MKELNIQDLDVLAAAIDDSGLARHLGLELIEIKKGYAKARMIISQNHLNFYGLTHGGALYALADHACSAVGNSLGRRALMIQSSTTFLANPKIGEEITAEGRLIHSGRRTAHLEVAVKDSSARLLISFTASCFFLDEEA